MLFVRGSLGFGLRNDILCITGEPMAVLASSKPKKPIIVDVDSAIIFSKKTKNAMTLRGSSVHRILYVKYCNWIRNF